MSLYEIILSTKGTQLSKMCFIVLFLNCKVKVLEMTFPVVKLTEMEPVDKRGTSFQEVQIAVAL